MTQQTTAASDGTATPAPVATTATGPIYLADVAVGVFPTATALRILQELHTRATNGTGPVTSDFVRAVPADLVRTAYADALALTLAHMLVCPPSRSVEILQELTKVARVQKSLDGLVSVLVTALHASLATGAKDVVAETIDTWKALGRPVDHDGGFGATPVADVVAQRLRYIDRRHVDRLDGALTAGDGGIDFTFGAASDAAAFFDQLTGVDGSPIADPTHGLGGVTLGSTVDVPGAADPSDFLGSLGISLTPDVGSHGWGTSTFGPGGVFIGGGPGASADEDNTKNRAIALAGFNGAAIGAGVGTALGAEAGAAIALWTAVALLIGGLTLGAGEVIALVALAAGIAAGGTAAGAVVGQRAGTAEATERLDPAAAAAARPGGSTDGSSGSGSSGSGSSGSGSSGGGSSDNQHGGMPTPDGGGNDDGHTVHLKTPTGPGLATGGHASGDGTLSLTGAPRVALKPGDVANPGAFGHLPGYGATDPSPDGDTKQQPALPHIGGPIAGDAPLDPSGSPVDLRRKFHYAVASVDPELPHDPHALEATKAQP